MVKVYVRVIHSKSFYKELERIQNNPCYEKREYESVFGNLPCFVSSHTVYYVVVSSLDVDLRNVDVQALFDEIQNHLPEHEEDVEFWSGNKEIELEVEI